MKCLMPLILSTDRQFEILLESLNLDALFVDHTRFRLNRSAVDYMKPCAYAVVLLYGLGDTFKLVIPIKN
jgi:hypothetical protein